MTKKKEDPRMFDQIKEEALSKYWETRVDYIKRMEKDGFVVRYPSNSELFIDIDSEEMYDTFKKRLEYLKFALRVRLEPYSLPYKETPSKSGLPRRHIVLSIPNYNNLSLEMKLVLQIFLGSDPIKELLSLFRIIDGDIMPCIFIEKKRKEE